MEGSGAHRYGFVIQGRYAGQSFPTVTGAPSTKREITKMSAISQAVAGGLVLGPTTLQRVSKNAPPPN